MKFLNDFKNIFAIVGVVSIIFWTCASDSTSDSTSDDNSSNLPPQLTGGTYQVEVIGDNILVLNTVTGVMKEYFRNAATEGEWAELSYYSYDGTTTFTH